MKAWCVKSEGITHQKQQELLDRAVDAGAVLHEYRKHTRHENDERPLTADYMFFGVNSDNETCFGPEKEYVFGPEAVEMTYDEAWIYANGIIRANKKAESSISREYALFNRVKQPLGSRDVAIAGEDHLVGQVKGDAHKAKILDKIIEEFNINPGQNIIAALASRVMTPVVPAPTVSMLTKLRKVLDEPDMGFDDLLRKVDDNMDVANAARHFMESTYYVTGDDFKFPEMTKRFNLLAAVLGIKIEETPVSPAIQPVPPVPAPTSAPVSILTKLREIHGESNASVDEIVENYHQLKEIAHKVYELNQYCQENNIGEWGDSVIDSAIKYLKPITNRSKPRNKYDREIIPGVYVDVYDVLNAFTTGGPEIDHGVKKLLAPGERGNKDEITDLEEAIKSIQRRIEHIKEWSGK